MNSNTRGVELPAQAAVEAEGHLLRELGTQGAMPRQRDERSLDAAVQVSAIDVKEPDHMRTLG